MYKHMYIYMYYTGWLILKDGADLGKPLGTDLNFGKAMSPAIQAAC